MVRTGDDVTDGLRRRTMDTVHPCIGVRYLQACERRIDVGCL